MSMSLYLIGSLRQVGVVDRSATWHQVGVRERMEEVREQFGQ